MPESVKQEILNEGARRAVNTTYKNMRVAFFALLVAVICLTVGNIIGWTISFREDERVCAERQERVEGQRRVWNAVFDELEKLGVSDQTLDRLQIRVDEELSPVNC